MANITKTPAKTYKAIIRRRGPTVMKTFRTKADVKDWARQVEDQMVRGAYIDGVGAERLSLEQAPERYPLPSRARRGQTVATHIGGKRWGRMRIIDAQVHLWRSGTANPPHLPHPFLVEDAIRGMDEAGVDGAILHPPLSWDPDSNEQAIEAALANPRRFAILAYPPLDRPDSRTLVARMKERPGVLGLRFYFNQPHNRAWPTDGTLDWLWPTAEEAGLPVTLLAGDWLPLLGRIAARHPDLKLMVDHMGALRGAKGDAAFPNMGELDALARYSNVAVKLTGGPFYAEDGYPFRSLHKHYRVMYDAFGPHRLFWGTDITKMPCTWRECVTHFQAIDWIPETDKRLIMGDAICEWLGWQR